MSQIAFVNRHQTSIRFVPHLGAIPAIMTIGIAHGWL